MKNFKLDRRRTLSGIGAVISGCMIPCRMTPAPALAEPHAAMIENTPAGNKVRRYIAWRLCPEQQALWHAPFQAEFLDWFATSANDFTLPVSVDASPGSTELCTADIHSTLMIHLHGQSGIDVRVLYKGRSRTFVSFPVKAEEMADSRRWRNTVFLPQAQRTYASREACWREDCFELFLDWFNNDFVPATDVGLFGEDEQEESRWSIARLLRHGRDPRTGRPASAGFLQALLPLRTPASTTSSDVTNCLTSDAYGVQTRNG